VHSWVLGRPVMPPPEVIEYILLREMPGLTLEAIDQAPPDKVAKWLYIISEVRRAEARNARQGH